MARWLVLLAAITWTAMAAAEETKNAGPSPPDDKPACGVQADNCRACKTGADGQKVCSNIGIACQPQIVPCPAVEPGKAPPKVNEKIQ